MGEVKRWYPDVIGGNPIMAEIRADKFCTSDDYYFIAGSDYARLERERDELAQRESRLIEDFNEVCACRDRFVTRYTEVKAELTRLRAVEAAANLSDEQIATIYQNSFNSCPDKGRTIASTPPLVIKFARALLAEACGRKG